MTERIEKAILICEEIDLDLNGEPDSLAIYRETAEDCCKDGKSEADIIKALGVTIEETVNLYLEASMNGAEEEWEEDVYSSTYLNCDVNEDLSLDFLLSCNGTDYLVRNGHEILETIDDEIGKARDEYEAELETEEDWEYE